MNQTEAIHQLNLSEELLPVGNLNRPGLAMSPDHITIHNTANGTRSANARMHAKYMKGPAAQKRKVSWHFTVDDREVIKHLPVHERACHAGTREGNRRSIGIEICEFAGIDQSAANNRAALLVAVLLHSMALDLSAVVPHRHWSGKYCPHLLLDNGEAGWREFVDQVKFHLEGLTVFRQDASQMACSELRLHVVSLGNNGQLASRGAYGNNAAQVEEIVAHRIPQIMSPWKTPRLAVYAHGGLMPETSALQRLADWRGKLLPEEVCPLAVVWHTDFWSTLANILRDAIRRRLPKGYLDKAKGFTLDRLDDMIEPVAGGIGGKAMWDEMKENAMLATVSGGLESVAIAIASLAHNPQLHLVGHSAGAILHGPFAQLLATRGTIQQGPLAGRRGLGKTIESLVLWAPAITTRAFKIYYLPLLQSGRIKRFALYTLSEELERNDNCLSLYHKSLLYLVSNAFENGRATPILGMERFVNADPEIHGLFRPGSRHVWVRSGIDAAHSNAHRHGDFDDDPRTLQSTLAWIKNQWRDQSMIGLPVTFYSPPRQAYRRQGLAKAIGVIQPSSFI
ncbi:MAG: N-acetylmuramoyl-L-alanine amidase [Fimbriimonadaceae bacterium]|nr:N-acetylmuramoyl-L-alanine amidase [Fimbriimonadaceae bacterium]